MKLFRPYAAGPHVEVERDWLLPDNAAELAKRIERFWEARGHQIAARVESCNLNGGIAVPRKGWFAFSVVRSNLKNGLPPQERAR